MPLESKQPAALPTKTTRQTIAPIVKPNKRDKKMMIVVIALAAIAVISTSFAIYYYNQYRFIKNNPSKIVDDENKTLVNKVGQLMVLPTGETPTVATVTDLAPLKDQPFFANAKLGYKVIIYTNAKRAILYDPTSNRIVETAPLNLGQTAPPPTTNTNAPTKK